MLTATKGPRMTDDDERQAITAAMQRLLAGTPLRSSGNLDILTLAAEAGLKRNKLTHKHTDLKDRFYAECAAKNQTPDNEVKLRQEIAALTQRVEHLHEQRDRHRTTSETFARAMHVLTVENEDLRTELAKVHGSRPRRLRPTET
jgi:hypothetical protein